MALQTILQHEILTQFAYPFLLVFVLLFAILQKTKILGDDVKQINAIVSFVVGLILVSAFQPKIIISNLMLFLSVALVIMFVGLLLWAFLMGDNKSLNIWSEGNNYVKWGFGILIFVSLIIAVLWASGIHNQVFNLLFYQSWSNSFWTNTAFIAIIVIVLVVVLRTATGGKSK